MQCIVSLSRRRLFGILLACTASIGSQAQSAPPQGTPIPRSASIDRGREAYLRDDCYSCHGGYQVPDPRHGDLAKSALVQVDNDGSVLRGFIKSGSICTVATDNQDHAMMPGYWDMPDPEMTDLITYIHYTRQVLRYKELASESPLPGNSEQGKGVFKRECSQCHSAAALSPVATKSDSASLRTNILFPATLTAATKPEAVKGSLAHKNLLERYSSDDVRDLVAYLKGTN